MPVMGFLGGVWVGLNAPRWFPLLFREDRPPAASGREVTPAGV